ncbi:MAG: type II/IV secretion system ATPase subunit [Candidatus Methanoplasma sp.]|jgi:type IV secretory pathway ATPase VirB11/archaellum biosynthesis ATPase|nr:type II/IV secretion system ATPase subunit [Candidatus Methanoplasma sp.]
MPRLLASLSDRVKRIAPSVGRDRFIVSDYSDLELAEMDRMRASESERDAFGAPIEVSRDPACPPASRAPMGGEAGGPGRGSFMSDFSAVAAGCIRTKPSYADCWLAGSRDGLEAVSEYSIPGGSVAVGTAGDGETEYNLLPSEYGYSDEANAMVEDAIEWVRGRFRESGVVTDRRRVAGMARGRLSGGMDAISEACGGDAAAAEAALEEMCDAVYRHTVGLGVFDTLLSDPNLEDVYIDAPCEKNRIHVTMSGAAGANTHLRCRTNLTADRKEVLNLINVLKRDSGLQLCESNPILETDMSLHAARATVIGYPMSPNGEAVAIRKHSVRPWTLTRLVANGTIDPRVAGLISFLVNNRSTLLVCGSRGAGKSSLLSAMMFEFPLSQRILTIEDTMELPAARMRRMGYKVQSMLIDEKLGGSDLSRADEALRVSLRMGESAIVLGEVRGEEARTLYQSMRAGRAGSSIMGTIHGDSARSVFERVVHDLGIAPEAFMATDVLITLGTVRDRGTGNQIRRMSEIVATGDSAGEFLDMTDGSALFSAPVMRRAAASSQMTRPEIMRDIRARALIRAHLAGMGNSLGEEYHGPEWIAAANEHVSKARGDTAEGVLESFKSRFFGSREAGA